MLWIMHIYVLCFVDTFRRTFGNVSFGKHTID